MSYRVPGPLLSEDLLVVLFFVGVVLTLLLIVWGLYGAPCAWFSGMDLTSVPMRCVRELTR